MVVLAAILSISCGANSKKSSVDKRALDSAEQTTTGGTLVTDSATTSPTTTTTTTTVATTSYPLDDGAAFVLPGTAFEAGVEVSGGAPLPIRVSDHQCGIFIGPVGDIDGDGIVDVGLSCLERATNAALLLVFAGRTVLGGFEPAFAVARSEHGSTHWNHNIAVLGDIDGDGRSELGLGYDGLEGTDGFYSNGNVFRGATMAGTLGAIDAAWLMDTDGGRWSPATMVGAGDVDGDRIGDLWVPQQIDLELESEVYLVSGAALAAHPHGAYVPSPATNPHLMGESGDPDFDDYVFAVGDIDDDGMADMMVGTGKAGEIRLFLGSQFHRPGTILLAEAHAVVSISLPDRRLVKAVPAGDHDGDGKMDVYCGLETRTGAVQMALVPGASLAAGGPIALADQPGVLYHEDATIKAVTACDLDGDGLNELIFRIGSPSKLHVYNGADMSSPGPVPWATVAWTSHATCVGDLNGDGKDELALGIW
jgi:hypothetical protein